MFIPFIRQVITLGLMIEIISWASVSAVQVEFEGQWNLSKVTGEITKLCMPAAQSKSGAGTHVLTYERGPKQLEILSTQAASINWIFLALVNEHGDKVKHMFKLATHTGPFKINLRPWIDRYPILCVLASHLKRAKKIPPPPVMESFANMYKQTADRDKHYFEMAIEQLRSPPMFPMVSVAAPPLAVFAFEGIWDYHSLYAKPFMRRPDVIYLHEPHRLYSFEHVFKLEKFATLTFNDVSYSRAYVALVNQGLNKIKRSFELNNIRKIVQVPFDLEYPYLCLLKAVSKGGEHGSDPPKTFNDHQAWLEISTSADRVFEGIPPSNVKMYPMSPPAKLGILRNS